MGESKTVVDKERIAAEIPGYSYGARDLAKSAISIGDLERLKQSVGFTPEDERHLKIAGEVLAAHTKELVDTWRGVIAQLPHLARHSKDGEGNAIPRYSERSGLRFQQWILDTCFRPYDQDWLNYQQEIALRHTSVKKNATDGASSTPYIPLRDLTAFAEVIKETVRPFLASKGYSAEEVEKMHRAWRRSVQLQIALWAQPYLGSKVSADEW